MSKGGSGCVCMFSGRLFKVSYWSKYSLLAVAMVFPLFRTCPTHIFKALIGWTTRFLQWFWPTSHSGHCHQQCRSLAEQCHTHIFQLGWSVPHSRVFDMTKNENNSRSVHSGHCHQQCWSLAEQKFYLRCFNSDFDAVKSKCSLLIEYIKKTTIKWRQP